MLLTSTYFVGNITAEAANPAVYGPYYSTFTGSKLKSAPTGTLGDKCEKAVIRYGASISNSKSYTCRWYQQIERRVTTTIGTVIKVTYYPSYGGGR
ncbi:hypothetical protein ACTHAL_003930 [Priestia flexa]|uniref:hypothetical protein n=1 Tax=Priestia flexa TaxID=86664 RepID=UPI0024933564|nr:hypothetical protein [Priestia flexa]